MTRNNQLLQRPLILSEPSILTHRLSARTDAFHGALHTLFFLFLALSFLLAAVPARAHEGHRKKATATVSPPEPTTHKSGATQTPSDDNAMHLDTGNHHANAEKTPDVADNHHEESKQTHRIAETDETHHTATEASAKSAEHDHRAHGGGRLISWLGRFHPILVHFPIALILMTGLAELLNWKYPSEVFQNSARFMILGAGITAIPAVLLGLAYAYGADYKGLEGLFFWWHRFLGITTMALAISAAITREKYLRGTGGNIRTYYVLLIAAVITVQITGFLGGGLTFGPGHLLP